MVTACDNDVFEESTVWPQPGAVKPSVAASFEVTRDDAAAAVAPYTQAALIPELDVCEQAVSVAAVAAPAYPAVPEARNRPAVVLTPLALLEFEVCSDEDVNDSLSRQLAGMPPGALDEDNALTLIQCAVAMGCRMPVNESGEQVDYVRTLSLPDAGAPVVRCKLTLKAGRPQANGFVRAVGAF